MRERERKMGEELKGANNSKAEKAAAAEVGPLQTESRHKNEHERNSFKNTMQRPPPLTKRQIAVVSNSFDAWIFFSKLGEKRAKIQG